MASRNETIAGSGAALHVSGGGACLRRGDGLPFFWLADTAWLINARLKNGDMIEYLEDRASKGFTVIQVMALHSLAVENAYGDRAIPTSLADTAASGRLDSGAAAPGEGYWETLDYLFEVSAARGIYVALVPIWGTIVQQGGVGADEAKGYAKLLAARYRRHPNLVWLNGGDIRGSDHREVWEAVGEALRGADPCHPITFHPFGRTRSATWFHDAPWLDFNMFQSGHRDYGQRTPESEVPGEDVWRGEDNWRYVLDDVALTPRRPTLDGEPSYEDIPHGLHDTSKPRWTAADCRRYAYWALLAGAFGHSYGHNSIMQFQGESMPEGHFGALRPWREALNDPGARSMTHVRALMDALGGGPLEYAPELLASDGGERYAKLLAARAGETAVAYSYTGGRIALAAGAAGKGQARAWWYDPREGTAREAGIFDASEDREFTAPGPAEPGNDWLLVAEPIGAALPFGERLR